MKILYVLVSSATDYYYEQALISMMSAKHHMPGCFISLLTDRETYDTLKDSRNLINKYLSEKKIVDLDDSLSPMQKSRWLKTSMRSLINGDFLYVDVDTVFADSVDESLFNADVMGVPDGNVPLKDHPMKWFVENNLKQAGFDNSANYHINSGVLFFKDTPLARSFAKKWHQRWEETCKKNIFIDQTALHQAIIDSGNILKLLPNCMNAQFGRNINTLNRGVILHYYSSWTDISLYKPAYKMLQDSFLKKIRENPTSKDIQELIQKPKEAFDENTFIMASDYNEFRNSEFIQNLLQLYHSTDKADIRLFSILERLSRLIRKTYYKTIKIIYPLKRIFKKGSPSS